MRATLNDLTNVELHDLFEKLRLTRLEIAFAEDKALIRHVTEVPRWPSNDIDIQTKWSIDRFARCPGAFADQSFRIDSPPLGGEHITKHFFLAADHTPAVIERGPIALRKRLKRRRTA